MKTTEQIRTEFVTQSTAREDSRRNISAEQVMKNWWRLLAAGICLTAVALAQSPASSGAADGKEMGGFQVEQSVELGYRFTDVTGSQQVYDTFIDQEQGPRLLEQSFSMRSPEHQGALFDDLSVSSFGWGGDPENVARARISKYHWYDFTGLFRRDHNFFDYNLLANPLNPPSASPNIPVTFSPHSFDLKRRMYDFGLTLLPESKVSFRLGYSRNRSEGPSFSSFHEGTDVLLAQPWNVTQNSYRFGVDLRLLPKTTISYDQFLDYDKTDTDQFLASFTTFLLPNGTPVEFGLPWNPAAGSPCATPILNGAANPSCNGYFSYSRVQRVRTSTPTEMLSLTSNYFKRVNLTARGSYSSSDMNSPYFEFFDGLVTRTKERQFTFSGPAKVRRIAATADLGATVDLTRSIKLVESFRFDNWRIPSTWDSVETTTVGVGTPVTLLSPLGATTTAADLIANFLGMKTYQNLFQIQYAPTKIFGLNVGYRLRHRHVFKAEPETIDEEGPFEGFEGDDITVNEHGPLLNLWVRPIDALRINAEVEATTADNFITRISPRHRQQIRARATYKPGRWGTVSGSLNFNESSNGEADTDYRQHYRNFGFMTTLFPSERFSVDLSYNYTDALQNAYICYNGTFTPAGTIVNGCPTYDPANTSANPNPNSIYSNYVNNTSYFSGTVMFKPVKRLTTNIGYGYTRTDGNTTILNVLQPLGPLQFSYHQPLASLQVEVVKNVSLNAYWNYDQYKEDSFVGPTLPRNFHDNRTVLSMRYAF